MSRKTRYQTRDPKPETRDPRLEANAPEKADGCPKCGCKVTRIFSTMLDPLKPVAWERRTCRHCGSIITLGREITASELREFCRLTGVEP